MILEILNSKPVEYGVDNKFHISATGTCPRKLYMKMKGLYVEKHTLETLRIFDMGNHIHSAIRSEIYEKASSLNFEVAASEIRIPEQKYIAGKVDLILSNVITGEALIVDIKSCGKWTYNKVLEGIIPENYINQVQLYLHFLKLKYGYLLFVNKETGRCVEYPITYDISRCEKLINYITDFMTNYVEKNIEPLKCDGGMWGCDCCGIEKRSDYT